MPSPDSLGRLLGVFDREAERFRRREAARIAWGRRSAEGDIAQLYDLAALLSRQVADWQARLHALEVDLDGEFDPRRAAALVLETVFDELLPPEAWRVLHAALALAQAS
jgi:hypothetical protein